MPGVPGANSSSNGRLWPDSVAERTACTWSLTSQNQRSASGSASCSACAEATDTSRSLLEPPNRMVVRIASPALLGMIASPCHSDPLDFPLQLDSGLGLDALVHRLAQRLDVV